MKSLKNARVAGFSLIELMVVVGIIGVLATIAIPQYSKFSSRAKQSEAKVNLGGIYTVEKAYYVEGSTYSPCLAQIGYEASGQQRRYTIGFGNFDAGMNNSGSVTCNASDGNTHFVGVVNPVAVNSLPATSMNTQNFTAGAAGNVSGRAGAVDQWTVDQDQRLLNPSPQL
jgi:type IV pilus assembly protein PilA